MPGVFLYVLVDPRSRFVRYVGQTTRLIARRERHRAMPEARERGPIANWKRKLRQSGLHPLFVPVMSFQTIAEMCAAEAAWIHYYRATGVDLLNVDDGGTLPRNGMKGRKHSEEWRARMRGRKPWNKGRKMSASAVERMSLAATGRKQSAETIARRAASLRGQKRSAETCALLAVSKRGINNPAKRPEVREAISKTLRGRPLSVETRAKLVIAQRARRKRERELRV